MNKYVAKLIQEQDHLDENKIQEDLSELLKELHLDLLENMLHRELKVYLGYYKMKRVIISITRSAL